MLFCISYNVDAENDSVKYALCDTWGLLAAHSLNTLALGRTLVHACLTTVPFPL